MGKGVAVRPPQIKYHRAVGFPGDVFIPYGSHSLTWTDHAREAKQRYKESGKYIGGELYLPKSVEITESNVFELVTTSDWRRTLVRVGVRVKYDYFHDIALIVSTFHRADFKLVTAWVCRSTDRYDNLDTSNYCVPGQEEEYVKEQWAKRRDSRAGVCHEGAPAGASGGGTTDD